MRLKRNITIDQTGKYSLIEHDKSGYIENGLPHTENEFFVLKLKDRHALPALLAYVNSCIETDPELADDVFELAKRSGENSKWCKLPD